MDLLTIIQDRINTERTPTGFSADNRSAQTPSLLRQNTLSQVMTAIWENVFDRIAAIWPRGFVSTQEIHIAEIEIERVQALVISGKATLEEFRKSAESWAQIVSREISIVGITVLNKEEKSALLEENVTPCTLKSTDKIVEKKAMPTMGKDELQSIYLLFPVEWNKFDETTLERLAIMTIDGGLSDSEVLKFTEVH